MVNRQLVEIVYGKKEFFISIALNGFGTRLNHNFLK
jgi:hypothetical protein